MSSFLIPDNFVKRGDLKQEDAKIYNVPLTSLRVHDALQTALGTAGNDDLGLSSGTFGTYGPTLTSGDLGEASLDTARYGRFQFALPVEYVDGQTITLRVRGGMIVIADVTGSLDASVYKADEDSNEGDDLCATTVQDVNEAAYANFDFTVTPTGLIAGDMLDIRLAVIVDDDSTATANVQFDITQVQLLLDVRG
jgi:hypothetical protein